MEQELTEYGAIQIAMDRIENRPTTAQRAMAIVPFLLIMMCSMTILYHTYIARGNSSDEAFAPVLATILSTVMLMTEFLIIAYSHHPSYEKVESVANVMLRFNIFHLIVCASCASYVKTGDGYNTYFIWSYVLTLIIYLISFSPFVCGMIPLYS
jgi:membrane protein YdbS with pleckstrin-like domain